MQGTCRSPFRGWLGHHQVGSPTSVWSSVAAALPVTDPCSPGQWPMLGTCSEVLGLGVPNSPDSFQQSTLQRCKPAPKPSHTCPSSLASVFWEPNPVKLVVAVGGGADSEG